MSQPDIVSRSSFVIGGRSLRLLSRKTIRGSRIIAPAKCPRSVSRGHSTAAIDDFATLTFPGTANPQRSLGEPEVKLATHFGERHSTSATSDRLDSLGLNVLTMFSFWRAKPMSAVQLPDTSPMTELETEIDDAIAEHGSERAAIRALLLDLAELARDGDRASSRGYLRGLFSEGARPRPADDEP
ncbi:hypothetical protein ACQKLX_07240 [Bosea sp. NPDC003192]|uniref:hypothetical protein n=1 Tax=Bosea sp. NPDC003192 TaxID=3390551 RepID=UPI003CFF3643